MYNDNDYQCMSILGKKCTILVSDVDDSGGYTCQESIWEISTFFFQFYHTLKTALKNEYF